MQNKITLSDSDTTEEAVDRCRQVCMLGVDTDHTELLLQEFVCHMKGYCNECVACPYLETDRFTSRCINCAPHLSLPLTIPCFPGPAHICTVKR